MPHSMYHPQAVTRGKCKGHLYPHKCISAHGRGDLMCEDTRDVETYIVVLRDMLPSSGHPFLAFQQENVKYHSA